MEYIQTFGFAIQATNALLTIVQEVKEAKKEIEEIADRASRIEANLKSIKNVLDKMERTLKSIMPPDECDQLQRTIVLSLESCETALKKSFGLPDQQGNRAAPTIKERFKVVGKGRKIDKDRETLDSILKSLDLSLTVVSLRLHLEQFDIKQNTNFRQEKQIAFRSAYDELKKETQMRHTDVPNRDHYQHPELGAVRQSTSTESSGPSIASPQDSLTKVDSKFDSVVDDQRKPLPEATGDPNNCATCRRPRIGSINSMSETGAGAIDLNDTDEDGSTALHDAVKADDIKTAQHLIWWQNADVNLSAGNDAAGNPRTPLYLAVSNTSTPEREDMVGLLVRSGAKVDTSRLPVRWKDYDCLLRRMSR